MRQVTSELPLEKLDLRTGKLVERLEIVVGRDTRVCDDQDAVLHVIERKHGVEDHEAGFILQRGIGLSVLLERDRLEPRRGVVAQIANGAASKSGQLRNERRTEVGHHAAQHVDEGLSLLGRHAGTFHNRPPGARSQHDERIFAQK